MKLNFTLLATLSLASVLAGCVSLPDETGTCITEAEFREAVARYGARVQMPPAIYIGDDPYVCSCYFKSRLAGAGERTDLDGRGESASMAGAAEGDTLVGAAERDMMEGRSEQQSVVGAAEASTIEGTGEQVSVVGGGESAVLVGASEEESTRGLGEDAFLVGAAGSGAGSGVSCRTVPDCDGFSVVASAVDYVTLRTGSGTTTVPASCVTW